jgi:hypothetical protein
MEAIASKISSFVAAILSSPKIVLCSSYEALAQHLIQIPSIYFKPTGTAASN